MTEKITERKNKNVIITFRVFQALCFGIFALGLSLIAGDYTTFVKSPISAMSITTTMFGLVGALVCGWASNRAEEW